MHREWSTPSAQVGWVAAAGGIVVLLAVAALFDLLTWSGLDAGGMILAAGAGLVLLAVAAVDGLLRPRLTADAEGLTVRTVAGRRTFGWAGVVVRAVERRRLGTRTYTLEIDDGEHLVVLGRRELGASPQEVADEIARLRTAPPA